MPIFHLHIRTGDDICPDLEGMSFPDLAAAKAEAIKGARSLMCSEVTQGQLNLDQSIEIHGAEGQRLESVAFRHALLIQTDSSSA